MAPDNVKTAFRLPSKVNGDFISQQHQQQQHQKKISTTNIKISISSHQKVFRNIHRKRPVLKSLSLIKLQVFSLQLYQKKKTPTQVFKCEINENTFFCRAPASGRTHDCTKYGPNSNNSLGVIHIWRPLWGGGGLKRLGGGGVRWKWDVIRRSRWGLASVLDVQKIFFVKENWICAMTRHHANNILLARNLSFDSDVRQWSHPLMISLHCLWAKSNNRTRGQFEYRVTLFFVCFCLISFIHMHGVVAVP